MRVLVLFIVLNLLTFTKIYASDSNDITEYYWCGKNGANYLYLLEIKSTMNSTDGVTEGARVYELFVKKDLSDQTGNTELTLNKFKKGFVSKESGDEGFLDLSES